MYPVYTLKNECNDCYKCVRECQVKAIKIQDGRASVIDKKCIACGHCVTACPSNAKRVRGDVDKIKTLITAQKKVIASLAPSWAGLYEIESSKDYFCMYSDGEYLEDHATIMIEKLTLE